MVPFLEKDHGLHKSNDYQTLLSFYDYDLTKGDFPKLLENSRLINKTWRTFCRAHRINIAVACSKFLNRNFLTLKSYPDISKKYLHLIFRKNEEWRHDVSDIRDKEEIEKILYNWRYIKNDVIVYAKI